MKELDTTAKSVKKYFFKSLGLTNTSNQFMKKSLLDITVKRAIEHFLNSLGFTNTSNHFMKVINTNVTFVLRLLLIEGVFQFIRNQSTSKQSILVNYVIKLFLNIAAFGDTNKLNMKARKLSVTIVKNILLIVVQ